MEMKQVALFVMLSAMTPAIAGSSGPGPWAGGAYYDGQFDGTYTATVFADPGTQADGTFSGTVVSGVVGSALTGGSPRTIGDRPVTNLSIPGVPAPDPALKKQNGQFVIWMVNELLYRPPTYPEYKQYLAMLGGNPRAEGTAPAKADVVLRIMGFDPARGLFNPASEYNRTSAVAFAPFGRLPGTTQWPIVPTSDDIINFINLMESDTTPLPLSGSYAGVPGAPWRATHGMARAFQFTIFDRVEFQNAYPDARGLFGMDFVLWMTGNAGSPAVPAVMFPGGPDGGNARVNLANMLDETPTLIAPDASAIRQGAGAAFQSEFVAELLWAWSGVQGVPAGPGGAEKNFQLKLNAAALDFQLTGLWRFATAPLYSKAWVQTVLVNAGYADAATPTSTPTGRAYGAVTRPQTISFKLPSRLKVGRSYKLSARASSRLPVTFSLAEDSVSLAVLNGQRLTVTGHGVITVIAEQAGGVVQPAAAARRRGAPPIVYSPVSVTRSATVPFIGNLKPGNTAGAVWVNAGSLNLSDSYPWGTVTVFAGNSAIRVGELVLNLNPWIHGGELAPSTINAGSLNLGTNFAGGGTWVLNPGIHGGELASAISNLGSLNLDTNSAGGGTWVLSSTPGSMAASWFWLPTSPGEGYSLAPFDSTATGAP
jgi:hypothetical protein